jgi:integrase
MKGHISHMRSFFGDTDVRYIGKTQVWDLLEHLQAQGMSPKTRRNFVMSLRTIMSQAVEDGYATTPLPKITIKLPPQRVSCFTLDNVGRIIAQAHDDLEAYTIFWLAAETGMRAGEIAGLSREDVDLSAKSLTVRQSVWNGIIGEPKTPNAYRAICISNSLTNLLGMQLGYQEASGTSFVFSNGERPFDMNLFRRWRLKPILNHLQLQGKVGMHGFRHFCASEMEDLGVRESTRKVRLGHARSGDITADYTHAKPERNAEAATLLEARIKEAVIKYEPKQQFC